jgi:hypothetical protein
MVPCRSLLKYGGKLVFCVENVSLSFDHRKTIRGNGRRHRRYMYLGSNSSQIINHIIMNQYLRFMICVFGNAPELECHDFFTGMTSYPFPLLSICTPSKVLGLQLKAVSFCTTPRKLLLGIGTPFFCNNYILSSNSLLRC